MFRKLLSFAASAFISASLVAGSASAEPRPAQPWELPSDEVAAAVYVALATSPAAIAGVVSPLVEGPSGRAVTTRLPRVVASRAPEARTLRLDEIVVVKLVARGLTVDEVVPGGFRVVPRFDTPGVKLEGRF